MPDSGTDTKSLIGLQDLQVDTDNNGHGTFQRKISTSGSITLDKIDGNGIPWSNAYTRTIRPVSVAGNSTGAITGYDFGSDTGFSDNGYFNDIIAKGPVLDVRAYGADTTGAASSTAAIQAAIDALPANGGRVFLAPGSYKLSSSILINDNNVSLVGAGYVSMLLPDDGVIAIQVGSSANTQQILLKDFCIYGSAADTGGIKLGSTSYYAAFCKLENLQIMYFLGTGAYGINAFKVQDLHLQDCYLLNNYNNLYHGDEGYMTSTLIDGQRGYVGYASNYGILLEGEVNDLVIQGIVLETNAMGAIRSTGDRSHIVLRDAYIEGNNASGTATLYFSGSDTLTMEKVVISGCDFAFANTVPIISVDNAYVVVENNHGLFITAGGANCIATTATSKMVFSQNRGSYNAGEDIYTTYLAAQTGTIHVLSEWDYATGKNLSTGTRIHKSNSGYWEWNNTHLRTTQSSVPAASVHANAGTGAAAAVATGDTDTRGTVQLDTGSGSWSTGEQLRITFNAAYAAAPTVLVTPKNAQAWTDSGTRGVSVTVTATYFTISFGVADDGAKTYYWNYMVVE